MSLARRCALTLTLALGLLAGCGDDAPPGVPLFPADYAATYVEVRNCRQSADHDLHMIRVLADPLALTPYTGRSAPFPEGAVVLKEEYDFGDFDCSGAIVKFAVMRKLEAGSDPDMLDWEWQRVDAERRVVVETEPRCVGCHTSCEPPDGYDATCAVP